jgi:two-component system OmpR family sensor kinase
VRLVHRVLAALRWTDRRVPLSVRLVAGVLVLVAVTLLAIGYAGARELDGYLREKAGEELQLISARAERLVTSDDSMPGNAGLPTGYVAYLVDPDGRVLRTARSSFDPDTRSPNVPVQLQELSFPARRHPVEVTGTKGSRWLVLVRPAERSPGDYLVLGENLGALNETVNRLVLIEATAGITALAALAVACYWLVRLSIRPLRLVEATAEKIAAGDLSRRVPDRGTRTEIGRLGTAVNGMLGRIETALGHQAASEAQARASASQLRRFAADASHELRTPITTIRGYAEMYRQQRATMPGAEADRLVGRIEDQARRMGGLVDDLLLLAHLDQRRPLQRDPVDLTSLAADVVLDTQALSTEHPVELVGSDGADGRDGAAGTEAGTEAETDAEPVAVTGDAERLRQVIVNLVGNAVKHTPAGTPIEVAVGPAIVDGRRVAVLEVRDSGPGMSAEQAAHAFERFYRADPTRAAIGGGAGLGLAIVAAIVAAHDGTVELATAPGAGTRIRVTLPAG